MKRSKSSYITFTTLFIFLALFTFLPGADAIGEINLPPTVTTTSVQVINGTTVITGTASDDATPEDQIQIELIDSSNQVIATTVQSLTEGTWSWSFSQSLSRPLNTYVIKASDTGSPASTTTLSIAVDRPFIDSVIVDLYNFDDPTLPLQADLLVNEEMTRVLTNTKISLRINDPNQLITTPSTDGVNNPITIFNKTTQIEGTTFFQSGTKTFEFTPTEPLSQGTTYSIVFNPSLVPLNTAQTLTPLANNNGITAMPIKVKFTTVSQSVIDQEALLKNPSMAAVATQDPHGIYTSNFNICANCHGTHTASGTKLDKPKEPVADDSYCMACHDGTSAPRMENMDSTIHSKHETFINDKNISKSSSGSCIGCHNPHLVWSKNNPNLLKDHYEVEQHPPVEGVSADMFDSAKMLCEKCHDRQTRELKSFSSTDPAAPKVYYRVLLYKKRTAGSDYTSNFSLCFRCHDGNKPGTTNILTYYQPPGSKHSFMNSEGQTVQFPCAECHDTHRSPNKMMLKDKFGHENQQDSFNFTDGEWDASKERTFCLKCHNGLTTITGVTAKPLLPESSAAHSDTNAVCSSCHGTGTDFTEQSRSAAHAPH